MTPAEEDGEAHFIA